MNYNYKKLVLDPKCLQPTNTINNRFVYIDALEAIEQALAYPHITESEKRIIESVKTEVRKNRFAS